MKKCIFLFLIICFVIGCTSVGAADVSDETMRQYRVLTDLGLVPDSFNPDMSRVTRADFVKILVNMTNSVNLADNYQVSTKIKDVDESDTLYNTFGFVINRGYMNPDSDGSFRPNDSVSLSEVAIALTELCGYSATVDNINSEYMYTSFYKEVFRNITSTTPNASDIISVIYRCLSYPMMVPDGISGGYYTYTQSESVTFLSHYHRIIRGHGRFTGSGSFRINSGSLTGNSVVIEDKLYRCRTDKNFDSLAGENVYFYYSLGQDEVVAIESDGSGKRVTISSDELIGIDGNKIIYEVKGKEKKITLDTKADFCYNGKYADSLTADDIMIANGRLELVDCNSDNLYDAVMIWEAHNYIVKKTDKEKNMIYDRFSKPVLKLDDALSYHITDEFGYKLELKEIMPDDLLTVYSSKDGELINIMYSNTEIEGIIDGINYADGALSVNGSVCKVSGDYSGFSDLKPGDYGLALIDANGKIAYFKPIDKWCYGYIIAGSTGSGLKNEKRLLILSENGETIDFKLNKNVEMDGVSGSADDAYMLLCSDGTKVKGALVRYYIAGGGISRIDTVSHNQSEPADSLKYLCKSYDENGLATGDTLHYKIGDSSLNMKYPLRGSKLFLVPAEDSNSDISAYRVVMPNEYMQHDHGYHVDIYNSLAGSHYGEALVIYTGGAGVYPNIEEGSTITVVQSVNRTLDENGDESYTIYALRDSMEVKYDVKYEELISNLAPIYPSYNGAVHLLTSGDIVWIYLNAYGEIENIQLLYDAENDYLASDGGIGENNFALSKITKVTAYSADKGNILVTKTNPQMLYENEMINGIVDYSLVDSHQADLYRIYKCSTVRGKKRVSLASVDDIKDYKNYPDSYSKLVINTRFGDPGQIVIYE